MAKTTIEIDLKVKGGESVKQVEEKTKTLKQQLKEIKTLLASGTLDSDQFAKLSKEAGEITDQLGDVNEKIKNLSSDSRKLDAVVSAAQGIAGGFAAVQGIMALVGSENEDLQKSLLKVQGALATLNGIQAVANVLNETSALRTELAASGWNKLNDAMKASVIGAIITVIAVVVSQLENWTEATEQQISAQDELNSKLEITDRNLKATADNSSYFTKLKIMNAKAEGTSLKELNKIQEDANVKELDRLYQAYTAKQSISDKFLQKRLDAEFNYNFEQNSDNKKFLDEALAAEKQAQKEAIDASDAYNAKIDSNIIERRMMQIAEQEDEKKRAEETAKKRKERADKQKAFDDDVRKKIAEQNERDLILEMQLEEYKSERFAQVRAVDAEKINKDANDRLFALGEYNNSVAQAEWSLVEAKRQALNAGFDIAQMFVGKNKALADTLFVIQKGVAIANIIVDLQKEIAGYASNPVWTASPDGGASIKIPAIAAAKVRAATSIATIAATTVGRFMNGGGGASVGGGSASGGGVGSTASAPGINRFTPTTTSGGQSSQRVYVLEKDITDSQGRVAKIRHNATLI